MLMWRDHPTEPSVAGVFPLAFARPSWSYSAVGLRRVGVGIVGCGHATADFHLPALTRLSEARVVGLADPDPGRLAAAGALAPAARRHADGADLLADPEVEVVLVATPPGRHAQDAATVLDAGRHLLVEKPLTADPEEAAALAERAARSPLVCATAFNLRFHRLVAIARRMVADGELGPLVLVRSTWTGELPPAPPAWRRERASGGSVLWDLASHHVDLWAHLAGEPLARLTATTVDGPDRDDVGATVAGLSASGVLLSFTARRGTAVAHEVELAGERGRLVLDLTRGDGLRWQPAGRPLGPRTRLRDALGGLTDLPRQAIVARRGGDFLGSYAEQWRAMLAAARGEPRPPELATTEDGRAAVETVLALIESATPALA